ncbi:MAG: cytochrome c2 [Oceanicoccus sp.]|jgi:cytochrome c2
MKNLNYSHTAKSIHVGIYLAILIGCCLTPYYWFGVVPIKSDRVVDTEYIDILLSPIMPEDELERSVLMEEFRWCRYCHVMQPGHPDEPGPTLYNIFGRRAATISGFYYSDSFIEAGENKLYWTEETIDEFITDPQKYIPNNRMFHGPVFISDPERRKRVINLLKKWTAVGSTYGTEH